MWPSPERRLELSSAILCIVDEKEFDLLNIFVCQAASINSTFVYGMWFIWIPIKIVVNFMHFERYFTLMVTLLFNSLCFQGKYPLVICMFTVQDVLEIRVTSTPSNHCIQSY